MAKINYEGIDLSELSQQEKVDLGLKYLKQKKFSYRKAAMEAGIAYETLKKYQNLSENNESVRICQLGRRPLLNLTNQEEMRQKLNSDAIRLDAINKEQFEETLKTFINSSNHRPSVVNTISRSAMLKYKRKLGVNYEDVCPKPQSRVKAFKDIRNSISFCCLLNYLQSYIHRANYHSVDDVSIIVNKMGDKIKVLCTKEAKKALHNRNISVASLQRTEKQRVVTFSCTISGESKLTVVCIKFADYNFECFKETPGIFQLDEKVYIALYHYDLSDTIINKFIYSRVIIPAVKEIRRIHQQHKTFQNYSFSNISSHNNTTTNSNMNNTTISTSYSNIYSNNNNNSSITTSTYNSNFYTTNINTSFSNSTTDTTNNISTPTDTTTTNNISTTTTNNNNISTLTDTTTSTTTTNNNSNISTPTDTTGENNNASNNYNDDAADNNSSSTLVNTPPSQSNNSDSFKFIAILQDGAIGQINAIQEMLFSDCANAGDNIIFGKYAAGCSLTQSPNDKGVMHATLHKSFRSINLNEKVVAEYTTYDWSVVKQILAESLDTASYNTIWKCLKSSLLSISKAFNDNAINGALRDAGIISEDGKYSMETVLNQCPDYWDLKINMNF